MQVKSASEFHKSKRRRLGLHIYCKLCCAAASATRQKAKQPVVKPTVEAKACGIIAGSLPVPTHPDVGPKASSSAHPTIPGR